MLRLLKIAVITVIVTALLLFAALVAWRTLEPDYTVYHRERWVAERTAKPSENRRSLMVRDIETRMRVGMTKMEVVDLLGPSEGESDDQFIYSLGTPGYGGDYDSFVVDFDANSRVKRFGTIPG